MTGGFLRDGCYYDTVARGGSSWRRRGAIHCSLALHLAVLSGVQFGWWTLPAKPKKHDPKKHESVTLVPPDPSLFRPPRGAPPPPRPALPNPGISAPDGGKKTEKEEPAVRVQFVLSELPEIVAAFGGNVAFADPKDPDVLVARFGPPDWRRVSTEAESRDRYFVIEIQESNDFLNRLRAEHKLAGCRPYMVFPTSFSVRLFAAAAERPMPKNGHMTIWLLLDESRQPRIKVETDSVSAGND